jgi:hypothetical protein
MYVLADVNIGELVLIEGQLLEVVVLTDINCLQSFCHKVKDKHIFMILLFHDILFDKFGAWLFLSLF